MLVVRRSHGYLGGGRRRRGRCVVKNEALKRKLATPHATQEMWELKNRFWRSKLSRLTSGEVIKWLSNRACVDTDMSEHLAAFRNKQVPPALSHTHIGTLAQKNTNTQMRERALSFTRMVVGVPPLRHHAWAEKCMRELAT